MSNNRDYSKTGQGERKPEVRVNGKTGQTYLYLKGEEIALTGFRGYCNGVSLEYDHGNPDKDIRANNRLILHCEALDLTGRTQDVVEYDYRVSELHSMAWPSVINTLAAYHSELTRIERPETIGLYSKQKNNRGVRVTCLIGNNIREGYHPWDDERNGYGGDCPLYTDETAYAEHWLNMAKKVVAEFGKTPGNGVAPADKKYVEGNPNSLHSTGYEEFNRTIENALAGQKDEEWINKNYAAFLRGLKKFEFTIDEEQALLKMWDEFLDAQSCYLVSPKATLKGLVEEDADKEEIKELEPENDDLPF